MKTRVVAVLTAILLSTTLSSNAVLTGATYADDGDGAIVCPVYTIEETTDTLYMDGVQYWGPGHVLGDITTDSPEDPTITLANSLDNDTAFSWTAYKVNISLNNTFTISLPSVTTPGDWSSVITSQPVETAGIWTGTIDFTSGTPIDVMDTFEFSYKITFSGKINYSFCQEFIPIPEPTSLSLVFGGLLLLGGISRRK